MKNILVTGAGGFIGSHLAEELVRRGYEVRAFVRYNSRNHWGHLESLEPGVRSALRILSGDISDPFTVDEAVKGVDTVFHLAALIAIPYSYVAPEHFVRVNVIGTLNILKASLAHGVGRVIHTSTSETYGSAIYTPIDEKHPIQAQSPYSATKVAADKLAESFHLSFKLPVSTVRPFNTFGPRQSARAVIPTVISQVLGSSPHVKIGSLHPVRDFTYVKDTVEGFILAAASQATTGKVINLGTGRGVSVGELVELVMKLAGKRKDIAVEADRIRPEESEVQKLICDNSLAKQILGWSPTCSLEEGVRKTIEYISGNMQLYKSDIYNI